VWQPVHDQEDSGRKFSCLCAAYTQHWSGLVNLTNNEAG
jgi:hypothetical protein